MKKIFLLLTGASIWFNTLIASASEKFDVLPDLPEPLAAAQASSVSSVTPDSASTVAQSVGAEPNFLSVLISLIVVILLIYATGIIYAKLNKLGFRTFKNQAGSSDPSKASVISTTPLGNNKTLHVVELDGKRMLIGASANGIHLIKDLGTYTVSDNEECTYSKIEIPDIRIPRIEIPKIEFPNIGFTKTVKSKQQEQESNEDIKEKSGEDSFEFSGIYEESPDGIIDKLFIKEEAADTQNQHENYEDTHMVDPDEYALYKKYL